MFIKLTRFDNRPIWLNASFIVTVEPRKDGFGSVIVPIGDGFDYDVRESVAEILEKLEGAPVAAVVPVPAPDCLTKMPADVSPGPEFRRDRQQPDLRGNQSPVETKSAEPKPDKQTPAEQNDVEQKPSEGKRPRKRAARGKVKVEKAEGPVAKKPADGNEPELVAEQPVEKKAPSPLELSSDQVVRLAKLAPKSVSKLKNTLATQFHVADVGATVLALEAGGAFALDGNRVVWPAANAAETPQL